MGLLDDAIREHLELKRQHGADPDEVSRQEQEALGAARRAEFAKPEGQADETAAEAAAEAPEEAVAEAPAEEPIAEAEEPPAPVEAAEPFDVEAHEPPPEPEPEPEPDAVDPPPEPEAAKPGLDEDPWLADEPDEVPAGESLDHPRTEETESDEDVLEETPDFLQETPEHDRLWFEQRPPRDFDWDK
jgi:hypothetical protein